MLHTRATGSGYPILMLHGHPGSGACMDVFAQGLGDRFYTLAPDLRGYGRSRSRGEFEMQQHLADLTQLLATQPFQEFVILGWSLGGIVALELALQFPERVKGLILIATSARPWGNHPRTGWREDVLTGIAGLVNWGCPGCRYNIEWFGKRSLFQYLVNQHTPATYRYLARYALPAYLQTSAAAHRALGRALRDRYNRLADLAQIQCPALVLAAAGDRHITPTSSLETAQHLPNATSKVYPEVAHLFPWEIPDQVVADIRAWLATLELGEADLGEA